MHGICTQATLKIELMLHHKIEIIYKTLQQNGLFFITNDEKNSSSHLR